MSTTPHTPGPWRIAFGVHGDPDIDDCEFFVEEDAVPHEVIATVLKVRRGDSDANARLIATAPETAAERDRLQAANATLVAALAQQADATENLLREIRRHPKIEWDGTTILAALEAVKTVRAALKAHAARTEGRPA